MSLPPFLQNVPNRIIRRIKPRDAWLYQIIPYGISFSPSSLIVAMPQRLNLEERRSLCGKFKEIKGTTISSGEGLSPLEMNEVLEKYYS